MHNRTFTGNTFLHFAVLKSLSAKDFLNRIANIDCELLRLMATTKNNESKLPVELVSLLNIADTEKEKLCHVLLELTLPKVKPLTEKINFDEVCATYGVQPCTPLHYHLKVGCEIANDARSIIDESSTHPQINQYDYQRYARLNNEISNDRDEVERKRFQIIYESEDTRYHKICIPNHIKLNLTLSENTYLKIIQNQTHLVKTNRRGNCGEFCDLNVEQAHLLKNLYNCSLGVFEIDDHVICIIGQDTYYPGYKGWKSKDNVVIDSWLGEVYPASEIPNKLKDYDSFKLVVNGEIKKYCYLAPYHAMKNDLTFNDFISKNLSTTLYLRNRFDVAKFIAKYLNQLSNKELYLFNEFIRPQLIELIKDEIISLKDLYSLNDPIETLKSIFLDAANFRNLKQGQCTLKDFETMSDTDVFTTTQKKSA